MKSLDRSLFSVRTLNTFDRFHVSTVKHALRLLPGRYVSTRVIAEIRGILG